MQHAPWLLEDAQHYFPLRAAKNGDAKPYASENEGALSIDVYDYPDFLLVRAPIAGVLPADLDLSIHHDMLTIRGKRAVQAAEGHGVALHQECHWGSFSRSLILPVAVRPDDATADLTNGVLTIRLPKSSHFGTIPLRTS